MELDIVVYLVCTVLWEWALHPSLSDCHYTDSILIKDMQLCFKMIN